MSAARRLIGPLAVAAVCSLALAAGASAAVAPDADGVASLPTLGPVAQPQFAGYSSVTTTPCADVQCTDRAGLFYWLFGKTAPNYRTEPTIVWSNGGPGASSFYGPLSENGPYNVNAMAGLVPNPDSWTQGANYLFFDHPLGTGLSFPFKGKVAPDLATGIAQLYNSLVGVVKRRGLENSPLYLTGESYGGTYMPLLAKRILDGNAKGDPEVRLGGVIIAAGWVDPLVQVSTTADYALSHGLIDADQKVKVDRTLARCRKLMRAPPPSSAAATNTCYSIQNQIRKLSGRYLANIAQSDDIDYQPLIDFVNRPDVRVALHAPAAGKFSLFSEKVGDAYTRGGMDSYRSVVAELLDRGVPVLVITGLNDAKDTNVIGTRAWISKLAWRKGASYRRATRTRWRDGNGLVLGYVQKGGGLTNLEVLGAGHLGVRDEPRILDQVERFMAGG
ncbi:MAG: vitellogenic carboxypeptidase-like protein [Thermoleophilaceae bacterium]|nr:vitellogenic carboxypeptidase-like protein [Thermoleophilaceae bacterium]